jgi:hypothetical protein
MNSYFHDGLILGVLSWKFILALGLLILGAFIGVCLSHIMGCGDKNCWLRFMRSPSDKPARISN